MTELSPLSEDRKSPQGPPGLHSSVHPGHLLLALLLCWVGSLVLEVFGPSSPPPGVVSVASFFKNLLGLPLVCFLPGLAWVPRLFPGEGGDPRELRVWDPIPFGLQAFLISVGTMVVNFTAIKLGSREVTATPLLLLLGAETLAGLAWNFQALRVSRFRSLPPSHAWGLALGAGVLLAWGALQHQTLRSDLSHYFYSGTLERGERQPVSLPALGLSLKPQGGWSGEPGSPFPPSGTPSLRIENSRGGTPAFPVTLLYRGPVGTTLHLVQDGTERASRTITRTVAEKVGEGAIERYWDWGMVEVTADLTVPPEGTLLTVQATGFEKADGGRWTSEDASLWDLSTVEPGDALLMMKAQGFKPMHYYQLLNVAENVRWAEEYTRDGYCTLNQPPLWSYVYASIRVLMGPHLLSVHFFYLLLLFGIFATASRLLEIDHPSIPALAFLPLALLAVSHGRLMANDGSANFPDNLFALGILASVLFALRDLPRTFVAFALAATVLRYPGATVVGFSLIGLWVWAPSRRRQAFRLGRGMVLGVGGFCLAMLLWGGLSGLLSQWLKVIHFETLPEHFRNNQDPLPIAQRPIEFIRQLTVFTGFLFPFALPAQGRVARITLTTALLYIPFLAFIDHFSHHYFLPLLPLVGVAAVSNGLSLSSPGLRWGVILLQGALGLLGLVMAQRWGW